MDLPVIDPPVAPRWIWMEEVTYSHIPIAALITAFLVLAPILEWIGWRRGDQRFDRLAKSLVYFTMILYSPGAALGTGIPIFIIGFWPEFWHRWAVMFFWPLVLQFIFFLLDVAFLFFGYYLCWDRLKNNKPLHLFFGVMSALFGVLIQVVWDALGGYMTTTGGVEMPPISQPLGMSWAGFFNPSFPWLFFHRSFANISWAMLLTGGIFALKYWRQKDPEEKAYYGWASDLTFTIGVLAIFALPFIGWGFAGSMQGDAPVAFHAVMGGHISDLFLLKMILIAFVVILGGFYLFARQPSGLVKWSVTLGCAVFWLVLSWHPPLNWFGGPWAWRIAYTAGLGLVLTWFWLFQGPGQSRVNLLALGHVRRGTGRLFRLLLRRIRARARPAALFRI